MKVLFVCLGNICRSPLAKGILRHKARKNTLEIEVDSAGFEAYHVGEGADPRSLQIAAKHGIDISDHVARRFKISDFDQYDRIFVMDNNNYEDVMSVSRNEADQARVDFIMNLSRPGQNMSVPDPYYGGKDGFENVYRMLDQACEALIEEMR
jgi:protein-tyrosine phosphatase